MSETVLSETVFGPFPIFISPECEHVMGQIVVCYVTVGERHFPHHGYRPECTKPSHSQSLANFVANFHSQGISAAGTKFSRISFAKPFAFAVLRIPSHGHSKTMTCNWEPPLSGPDGSCHLSAQHPNDVSPEYSNYCRDPETLVKR